MLRILKRIAGILPIRLQQELKMLLYAWQIRKHWFGSSQPEYQLVDLFVSEGVPEQGKPCRRVLLFRRLLVAPSAPIVS